MNTDRTYFAILNDFGPRIGIYFTEVEPSLTRAELVENVRRGENGFDNVRKVFAFNPVEHTADDITEDIFAAVDAEVRRLQDAEDFPVTARAMQAAE